MEYIAIGKIATTHGLKGEVKIDSWSDFDEERYLPGNRVFLERDGKKVPLEVATFRMHKNCPLVSFEGHQDINLVEDWRGSVLYVEKNDRIELPEGEDYADDVIGMKAVDEEGKELGTVTGFEMTLAQPVLRIKKADGSTFLVPDVPFFVRDIKRKERTVIIHREEGLL